MMICWEPPPMALTAMVKSPITGAPPNAVLDVKPAVPFLIEAR
jgi:hypothetical protein